MNRRRAKASREYQLEVSRIEKIAEAAKYLAEERKRNEQSAVIEKANKYRKTGKNPESCFGIPMSFLVESRRNRHILESSSKRNE